MMDLSDRSDCEDLKWICLMEVGEAVLWRRAPALKSLQEIGHKLKDLAFSNGRLVDSLPNGWTFQDDLTFPSVRLRFVAGRLFCERLKNGVPILSTSICAEHGCTECPLPYAGYCHEHAAERDLLSTDDTENRSTMQPSMDKDLFQKDAGVQCSGSGVISPYKAEVGIAGVKRIKLLQNNFNM